MKKLMILLLVVLLSITLTACFEKGIDALEPVDVEISGENTPNKNTTTTPTAGVDLTAQEANEFFKDKGVTYLGRGQEDANNDRSSVRHIPGTKLYKVRTQINYDYTPTGIQSEGVTYVKIVGRGEAGEESSVRYEGIVKRGIGNSLVAELVVRSPSEDPRIQICFGGNANFDPLAADAVCLNRLFQGPVHNFELGLETVRLRFDIKDVIALDEISASRGIIVKNLGTAPITVHLYVPEITSAREEHRLEVEPQYVYLQPDEEYEMEIKAYLTYEGIDITGLGDAGLYAIPGDCNSPENCFNSARFKEEFRIELYD